MLVNLRHVLSRPLTIIGLVCMALLLLFNEPTSIYYYLTLAQLIFVPVMLEQLVLLKNWQRLIIATGQFAVTILYFTQNDFLILLCVLAYLLSTLIVASYGINRFLRRGFVNTAEMMIDIGLIYIVMGGLWFLAFHLQLNTGFSPIITWLTAIHFHYSAFLLCITVGLIGRLHMTRYYKFCCAVIAAGPMLVAVGITLSRIVEIISVSLYVLAIFSISFMKWPLPRMQRLFIRLAFLTLCFTIIWSFLYAYSNLSGTNLVDIPDMLDFHGLLNCLGFGIAIVIGWSLFVPPTKHYGFAFPVSKIRGRFSPTNKPVRGLVDDMASYVNKEEFPELVSEFYESTTQFELKASVQWATWFKPFAFVYQFISRKMGQLNLPFSSKTIMMDGEIWQVDPHHDGREKPRVWQRSVNGDPVFNAIYSTHQDASNTYMNIALPLPFSSMHGILQLSVKDRALYLTSDGQGDAGTYLAIGSYIFKLPLHEYFVIKEQQGALTATHQMTLFGMKFLQIDYYIQKKADS
ncbi:YndJ family protein [Solibacillus isronensis]|uniref:YndJ family protein n=1 Tax=Solibacillus isronensis TaxID=412383 RepID=UPI0009A6CB3A|nr:YndJ family protein [Solibacillus isronensis]